SVVLGNKDSVGGSGLRLRSSRNVLAALAVQDNIVSAVCFKEVGIDVILFLQTRGKHGRFGSQLGRRRRRRRRRCESIERCSFGSLLAARRFFHRLRPTCKGG